MSALERMVSGKAGRTKGQHGPDTVPAMLMPNEYVLPPQTVRALGGAAVLDKMVQATTGEQPGGQAVERDNSVFAPAALDRMMGYSRGGLVKDDPPKAEGQRHPESSVPAHVTEKFEQLQSPGMGMRFAGPDLARQTPAESRQVAQDNLTRRDGLQGVTDMGGGIAKMVDQQGRVEYSNVGTQAITDPDKAFSGRGTVSSIGDTASAMERMTRANTIRQDAISGGRGADTGPSVSGIAAPQNKPLQSGMSNEILGWMARTGSRRDRETAAEMINAREQASAQRDVAQFGNESDERIASRRNTADLQQAQIREQGADRRAQATLDAAAPGQQASTRGQLAQARQAETIANLTEDAATGDLAAAQKLRSLQGRNEPQQRFVTFDQEVPLDPKNPNLGTRKVPSLLNQTTGEVQPIGEQASRLPSGVTPQAAYASARHYLSLGIPLTDVNARLTALGLAPLDETNAQ